MEKKLIPQTPRESVATAEDVKRILELTPYKLKKIKVEQDKALEVFRSRALLTPDEKLRGRGAELERHHLQTGNRDALAEALAMQGKFEEAAKIAVREELKAMFAEKAAAVIADDADCVCPSHREENGLFIPNQYVESHVISHKHKKRMPAIRCRVCKTLNIRPAPRHLIEQQGARKQSLAGKQIKATEFFKSR